MEIRKYYEKEARLLSDHQKKMYHGDPWTKYWHGTRFLRIINIVQKLKFRSILEVGCAEGYYLKIIGNKRDSTEQFGLDISKGYLIKAKMKGCKAILIVGDASNLPFKDNTFDLVLCTEVFEHIHNPKKAFNELARTSKKYLLITVAGENLFYYIANKLKIIKSVDPFEDTGHGHVCEMRIKEILSKWAPEKNLKTLLQIVDCHFPIAFFQRHKMPTFLIHLIEFGDKIVNQLPVAKEYGSSQIGLLKKPAKKIKKIHNHL